MDAVNAVPLAVPIARAGTHQVALSPAELQLQEAWRQLRPQVAVNPGEMLIPLRHGRTCFTLLDHSPTEPGANEADGAWDNHATPAASHSPIGVENYLQCIQEWAVSNHCLAERPVVVLVNGLTFWSFCFKDFSAALLGGSLALAPI
eukprot:scaffold502094_cov42-Prasinocladus_malaysianus.AAC.1